MTPLLSRGPLQQHQQLASRGPRVLGYSRETFGIPCLYYVQLSREHAKNSSAGNVPSCASSPIALLLAVLSRSAEGRYRVDSH